ncbi:MAG: hypothetical protein KC431_15785 [Myxococcales bacterium]|nr:hypothetical protein [Myxococcales bacterium]
MSVSTPSPSPSTTAPGTQAAESPRLPFESGVRSILEDRRGDFWFGSHSEGACRLHDGSFTCWDLSDPQVRNIYEDADGVIWFERSEGLSRFDGETIVPYDAREYGDADDWRAEPGDLWFKGDAPMAIADREADAGVFRWDGERMQYLSFPPLRGVDRETHTYHSSAGVARGAGGRLWFPMYGAVVGYHDGVFTVIDSVDLHVRAIHEDRRGVLWIGNNGVGVMRREGDQIVNFTDERGMGERLGAPSLDRVFSITEDANGHIWFGTVEHGAFRWDGESLAQFSEPEGLASHHVFVLYVDRGGTLWAGGADPSGVARFDGAGFVPMY